MARQKCCPTSLQVVGMLFLILIIGPELRGEVILNEIMYNPEGADYYTEYIELYNSGIEVVNLAGWMISDGEGTDSLIGGPGVDSLSLSPGGYALVLDSGYWANGGGLYDNRIPVETLLLTVEDAALGSGGLANSRSETVGLLRPDSSIASSRAYLPDAPQGVSEERVLVDGGEGDDNWAFSTVGGTPGYRNSVTPRARDLALDSLQLEVVGDQGNAELRVTAWVGNVGLEESAPADLALSLDRHHAGTPEVAGVWEVPPLGSGGSWTLNDDLGPLSGGHWLAVLALQGGDDNPANDSLGGSFHVPWHFGSLRFSELMPDPPEALPVEWIEIVNRTGDHLPMMGWGFADAGGRLAEIDTTSPLANPGYLVIAAESTMVMWPGLDPDRLVVPRVWPSLNNGGDTLTLFDPTGSVVDNVAYGSVTSGNSLVRVVFGDEFSVDDWIETPDTLEATPGSANPDLPEPPEPWTGKATVTLDPNPFSPNGDGYEDELSFSFAFPTEEVRITLRLFDVNGRRITTLLDDFHTYGVSSWRWDGREGLDGWLSAGIYVWHVDARSVSGDGRWQLKGALVSAGVAGKR